ncbi:hypothetical protein LCGC14_0775550 [marine sediment metagenome]|uniref:Uncharacterized protein n=1 Tax=marine sediment metagenome TaxID=412755 RepID=A0A0F9PXE0_9ZZZZ
MKLEHNTRYHVRKVYKDEKNECVSLGISVHDKDTMAYKRAKKESKTHDGAVYVIRVVKETVRSYRNGKREDK